LSSTPSSTSPLRKSLKSPNSSPQKLEKAQETKSKKRKNIDESKTALTSKKDKSRPRPHTWQDHEITNQYGTAYITFVEKFRPMLLAQALTWQEEGNVQFSSNQHEKKQKLPLKSSSTAVKLSTHVLVVEVPWLMLVQSLPNPLYRHRYGT